MSEKTEETKEQPKPGAKQVRRDITTTVVAWIAMFVAVLALAGGIYLEKEREKLKDRIGDLRNELHDAERDFLRRDADLVRADSLQRLERETGNRLSELERNVQESGLALEHLRRQAEGVTGTWVLAETEHALQMAMRHLEVEREPAPALVAMRGAERRLRDHGEPGMLRIADQLARDIEALEGVDVPDRRALALTLDGISNRIGELPLVQPEGVREWRDREGTRRLGVDWSGLWRRIRQSFHSMITVRRGDRPAAILLTPEQEYFVYLNAQLKIETARLAVMQRDATAFRTGLRSTRNWVETWFDADDPTVQAVISELRTLEQRELDPELPDISGTLRLLRDSR